MATAGWYPDPSGQPSAFRYWDGARWSEALSSTPYAAPPSGMAPPPPPPAPQAAPPAPPPPPGHGGFDQPSVVPGGGSASRSGGYESYAAIGPLGPPDAATYGGPPSPPSPPPRSPGSGRTVALVLAAVGLTLLLGIGTFFVVGALIDDDPTAAAPTVSTPAPELSPESSPEESPEPSPEPSPEESPRQSPGPPGEQPTALQCAGGLPGQGVTGTQGRFMTGGGLRLRQPPGFDLGDQAAAFTFADGVYAPSMLVEEGVTSQWVAVYALGSLSRGNGFDSPQQAAETVVACMRDSPAFYSDVSGSTELDSAPITVAGTPAWELTEEIRIDDPELSVEGDVVKVVVVDTGDPEAYALHVSAVPIGDEAMIDEQDAAVGRLTLD